MRTTSCRISARTPRRPFPFFVYVHLRATSCRCHRSSVSGVTTVVRSRKAARPSLWARIASRRRSSSVNRRRRPPELPPEDAILFDQIGERLSFPAIQPTGDAEEQDPKHRRVDHKRELISEPSENARNPFDPDLGPYGHCRGTRPAPVSAAPSINALSRPWWFLSR